MSSSTRLGLLVLLSCLAGAASFLADICEDASGALTAVRGECPAPLKQHRSAGVNIFDILWDASSGQTTPGNLTDTVKALNDAKTAGVRYFRFFASLWGPNRAFWYRSETRAQYWSEFDLVMDAVQDAGLYAIASIGTEDWNLLSNETLNDLVLNASSISRGIALDYVTEITTRYASHPNILAWELGNELNLRVNVPPPVCGTKQCFNTSAMVSYCQALSAAIRRVDPSRPISSGFSAPRPSAWHNEHCPMHGPCPAANTTQNAFWELDSEEQWGDMLALENQAVEIISVHDYSAACFFDKTLCGSMRPIAVAAQVAAEQGKLLFVGEYGNSSLSFATAADREFPTEVLDSQVASVQAGGAFALSAVWAWECVSHRQDMGCIWPHNASSGGDAMITVLQNATAAMQQ